MSTEQRKEHHLVDTLDNVLRHAVQVHRDGPLDYITTAAGRAPLVKGTVFEDYHVTTTVLDSFLGFFTRRIDIGVGEPIVEMHGDNSLFVTVIGRIGFPNLKQDVKLTLRPTAAFTAWAGRLGDATMNPGELAEFFEDWGDDLEAGPTSGAHYASALRNLRISKSGGGSVEITDTSEQATFSVKSSVEASPSEVALPTSIVASPTVWFGHDVAYRLRFRLYYRVTDDGSVVVRTRVANLDAVREKALIDLAADLKNAVNIEGSFAY